MSLFKRYSPKYLYMETVSLTNTIFHRAPTIDIDPSSYFQSVSRMHTYIIQDLKGIFPEQQERATNTQITIEQLRNTLVELEQILFGSSSDFAPTIEGCCLHTKYINDKLSFSKNRCQIL